MPNELYKEQEKQQEIQVAKEETVQKEQFAASGSSIFAQLTNNKTYDTYLQQKLGVEMMRSKQMPTAVAPQKTAKGKAVQKHRPSRKTEKAQKETMKQRMAAKKECPLANENSLMALNSLKEYRMHQKANQAAVDEMFRSHLSITEGYVRQLSPFFKPCKLNKEGKPKSAKDRAIQKANAKLILDTNRLPTDFLDKAVASVLAPALNTQMFTPQYLARHAGELSKLDDQISSMTTLMKDYKQSYFDELPKEKLQALKKVVALGPKLHYALSTSLGAMAVNYSKAEYIQDSARDTAFEQVQNAHNQRDAAIDDLSNRL